MHTPSSSLQAVTENLMANEWFSDSLRAAQAGEAEAQFRIGMAYANEAWHDDVAAEAVSWLERAARQGHVEAQWQLAYDSCPDFSRDLPELQNDPEATVKWMLAAAEQGHAEAIDYMGDIYANGLAGMPRDGQEAAKWYLLGARRGLGLHFAYSLIDLLIQRACWISAEDEALLVDSVRYKANEGDHYAQRTLGNLYAHGLLWQPVDEGKAVHWHSLAAADEDECPSHFAFDMRDIEVFQRNAEHCGAGLQRHLGQLFEKEDYRLRDECRFAARKWPGADLFEAARWYERSAEQGDARSQFQIALMYDRGTGVEQRNDLAAKWYARAAEQGNPAAANNLGTMYDSGRAVEKNDRLARRWFLAAARQGDEIALYNLGLLYQDGQGVRESKALAQRWFSTSAKRGYVWAKIALALVTEDPNDLLRAAESLFLEHKKVALGRMDDCVAQVPEFRERLHALATRASTPANALLWESSWDYLNGDRRHWWRKLSMSARVATTLRGILYLVDEEQNEQESRVCFQLAAANADLIAAYYLATLEWNRESYDTALGVIKHRYGPPGTAASILTEFFGYSELEALKRHHDQSEGSDYSHEFLESLDIQFRDLDQNIRNSKARNELYEARKAAAEEEHKRTLSFLTHTLNNSLSTGPETVRTVIEILGGDHYDQGPAQYKAINNMASLFSVFVFAESLLKTFKLYVSDPEQLREKWASDRSGDATVSVVLAMALRQSSARVVFSPNHLAQLKRLLPGKDKETIKQVRKSFVDEMIPLEISLETAGKVFTWVESHFSVFQIDIAADAEMRFSSNATRYMFFFAAFSELIYNALKYADGGQPIRLRWFRKDSDYWFSCVNSCAVEPGFQSAQEGSNGGLLFINKLMLMLRDSALSCRQEEGEYTALLRFGRSNFGDGQV